MRWLLGILLFSISLYAAQDPPHLRSFIKNTCASNSQLCQPSIQNRNLQDHFLVQCHNLRTQYGCNELEKNTRKEDMAIFSCDPKIMCETKNKGFRCALGGGEAMVDLLIGIVTLPWHATKFISKAFEQDRACFENQNQMKENLIELYDLSIAEEHAKYKIPPEIKLAMKNWPCTEIRRYLTQKNQTYQTFLGPLVAQGKWKPEYASSALSLMIEELKKEIGIRWECYQDHAKMEIACYSLALLIPSVALKIPAQATARMADYDLSKVWQRMKLRRQIRTSDLAEKNPQLALWALQESSSKRAAKQLEAKIKDTLENGKIVSTTPIGKGIMNGQVIEFENGFKGIWKADVPAVQKVVAHREVAAYKVEEKLGSHLIPYTTFREIDGQKGSIQLLVRDLDNVDFVTRPQFFDYFDYLIANRDRHPDNILSVKGRPIAIDQGFSFSEARSNTILFPDEMKRLSLLYQEATTVAQKEQVLNQVRTMLPPEAQYQKLTQITVEEWKKTLGPYLNEGQIQKFVERKNEIVRTVEAAKKTFGNDIFPSGQFSPLMRVPHTYNSK